MLTLVFLDFKVHIPQNARISGAVFAATGRMRSLGGGLD